MEALLVVDASLIRRLVDGCPDCRRHPFNGRIMQLLVPVDVVMVVPVMSAVLLPLAAAFDERRTGLDGFPILAMYSSPGHSKIGFALYINGMERSDAFEVNSSDPSSKSRNISLLLLLLLLFLLHLRLLLSFMRDRVLFFPAAVPSLTNTFLTKFMIGGV